MKPRAGKASVEGANDMTHSTEIPRLVAPIFLWCLLLIISVSSDAAASPSGTKKLSPQSETIQLSNSKPTEPPGEKSSGNRYVEPRSKLEFVGIPGGTFLFGCEPSDKACFPDEKPTVRSNVDSFWLGKTPVTVDAYRKCVAEGACTEPFRRGRENWNDSCNWGEANRGKHPVNCVTQQQATAFCRWIKGRLPTAKEWEFAAKGGEGRIYPWGNSPKLAGRVNACDRQCKKHFPSYVAMTDLDDGWPQTSPVGAYPLGASKHGVLDLLGNIFEWTSTRAGRREFQLRGGAWSDDSERTLRNSNLDTSEPDDGNHGNGIRCVLDVDIAGKLNKTELDAPKQETN